MQVPASCMSEHNRQFEIAHAVIVYSEVGTRKAVFASVHDVDTKTEGLPTIKAGVPVSTTGLAEMFKALQPEEYSEPRLLGSEVLAVGSDYLAWWVKPQKRTVFFKCKDIGKGEVTAATDHPGLVFMVSKNQWHVFAVKGSRKPTAGSKLFVAPYFNVWANGEICTGNISLPEGQMKFRTEAWEEAFFRSYFTHPNQNSKELTSYKGGINALWKALLKGKAFDNSWLVPEPYAKTLGEAFSKVVRHG